MARRRPHPETLGITLLLAALTALGQFSTGMYLPSMPSLAKTLQTTPDMVNLTLSVFFASFAVAQLVYGPLSDRFGRRITLLTGLVVYFLASIACTLAPTIETLIAARFVQALGACAGPVISRAVIRDVYGRERSTKVLSTISLVFAVSPGVIPIVGGYLEEWFGWRSVFLSLSVLAGVVYLSSWYFLDETNRQPDRDASRPGTILKTYGRLLGNAEFLGYALAVALVFGGLMAYVASAPFLFIETLGLAPRHFGWIGVINGFGFLAGMLTAGRWSAILGIERTVLLGVLVSAVGGIAMTIVAAISGISIVAIIAPMILFLAGMALVFPAGTAGAMGPFPRAAGAASAMMGFFQMSAASIASAFVGYLPHVTQLPMAIVVAVVSLAALVAFLMLAWRRPAAAPADAPR